MQDMAENIMQAVILQDIIQMSEAPFVMHMFNLLGIFLMLDPLHISFVTGSARFVLADNIATKLIDLELTGLGFAFLGYLVSQYNKKSIPRLAEIAQLTFMQIVSNLLQACSPPGMHLVTAILLLQVMSPFRNSEGASEVYQYTAYQTVQFLSIPGWPPFAQLVLFGAGYQLLNNEDVRLILKMTIVQGLCVAVSEFLTSDIATDPVLVYSIMSLGIGEILLFQH